jgi:phospholipase D-like protein
VPRGLRSDVVRSRMKWDDLDPRTRRLIVVAGAIEGMLKIAALVDLARRPRSEVRGPKARWAAAVTLINALGAVPIAYFVWGRRK